MVDILNWILTKSLLIIGTTVRFTETYPIPKNTSIIFVANHQGLFDIPPMIWYLRKYHTKFVSKIELGKGIPSISFNLKHGGAALINRRDPKQALTELKKFGQRVHDNKWSAAIFPEGTRSVTGKPKKFYYSGLKMMIKYNPEAYIVPITINNSWKVFKYGKFPLGMFNRIKINTHKPLKIDSLPVDELLQKVEATIVSRIK